MDEAAWAAFERKTDAALARCRQQVVIDGTDHVLYVPSGDMKYPAFWPRDALWMYLSGRIPATQLRGFIVLTASRQADASRELAHGLRIPAGAIPDHITFAGEAVFFPGTYAAGDDQGDGSYGFFPPHDDQYALIDLVHEHLAAGGARDLLGLDIGGQTLWRRLERAFAGYNIDAGTGLCTSDAARHTIDWGVCDNITKSGLLFAPSVLRWRSAGRLSAMADLLGDPSAAGFRAEQSRIGTALRQHFHDGSGLYLSATGLGRQHDLIATLMAVRFGLVEAGDLPAVLSRLCRCWQERRGVDDHGYVRCFPPEDDFSPGSAWQVAGHQPGTYQNGGYWAYAAGYFIHALSLADRGLARDYAARFVAHCLERAEAPYEWKNDALGASSGCWYGPSIALPYAIIGELRRAGQA